MQDEITKRLDRIIVLLEWLARNQPPRHAESPFLDPFSYLHLAKPWEPSVLPDQGSRTSSEPSQD